jgi:hypothetical protein
MRTAHTTTGGTGSAALEMTSHRRNGSTAYDHRSGWDCRTQGCHLAQGGLTVRYGKECLTAALAMRLGQNQHEDQVEAERLAVSSHPDTLVRKQRSLGEFEGPLRPG